ncbi:AraC family transcriptional regulator [Porticoccaceae bacterium]|nr:AraC family transcriptional regulator [Porticoccaceae bacterium]MDA8682582.1 AraC family transcriptional regulator [Porticoccaceae bacterium]MDB2635217.1 AraC family transcriptional regulator [Porticoccaceae bacterium]MDB2663841.1 AraC family transcriptional regulator [Porticoccaceae bacterium]
MHQYVLRELFTLVHQSKIDSNIALDHLFGHDFTDAQSSVLLTAAQADKISSQVLAVSDNQRLGLILGSRLNMLSMGIFGYALMSCSRVSKSLKLLHRYNRAILPSVTIDLFQSDEKISLVPRAAHLIERLQRFYIDTLFSALVTNVRLLTGTSDISVQVNLSRQGDGDLSLYQSCLGNNIEFNAAADSIVFGRDTIDSQISTSNNQAQAVFQRECDRIMSAEPSVGLVSERVKQALIAARLNFPTADQLAAELHMSESTLQRRLRNEGWRYQQLLDQVRNRLALEYLYGTQLPVSEIADLLGFNNAANFRRAFKRWSGDTPAAVRKSR